MNKGEFTCGQWRGFAVFSDIHANLPALQSALTRVKQREQEWGIALDLYVNGDTLDAGPHPREVLDLLEPRAQVFILGNHETYLEECLRQQGKGRYLDPLWRFVPWTIQQVGSRRLTQFLNRNVFHSASSDGVLQFFHASPQSNSRCPDFFERTFDWNAKIPPTQRFHARSIGFFGHSHFSHFFQEPRSGMFWVNTGSVGYPFVEGAALAGSECAAVFVAGRYRLGKYDSVGTMEFELTFEVVPYKKSDLIAGYLETGALENCAPYSLGILAQSLFNRSIVFPAFQLARKNGIPQPRMGEHLLRYLVESGVKDELEACFESLGFDCKKLTPLFEQG